MNDLVKGKGGLMLEAPVTGGNNNSKEVQMPNHHTLIIKINIKKFTP